MRRLKTKKPSKFPIKQITSRASAAAARKLGICGVPGARASPRQIPFCVIPQEAPRIYHNYSCYWKITLKTGFNCRVSIGVQRERYKNHNVRKVNINFVQNIFLCLFNGILNVLF